MVADDINTLGNYLGCRDIEPLTSDRLEDRYGIRKADLFVLFGGSILAGAEVFANAVKEQVAHKFVIVGGHGHTTDTLRRLAHEECPEIQTKDLSEAEIFNSYIRTKYHVQADLLECGSTNCGNNITLLLDMLEKENIEFSSIILCQDATMQRRMSAGLQKYRSDAVIINYASYKAKAIEHNGSLEYEEKPHGMWSMDHYITLLMGEIPRLIDDRDGYGPMGRNYIAHVDIPNEVAAAFTNMKEKYSDHIRTANPEYATNR